MKNKLIELVREFNLDRERGLLQYVNNGFAEAIKLPELYLFDDDGDNKEYVEELTMSRLSKYLYDLSITTNCILKDNIARYFFKKQKQLIVKFPRTTGQTVCAWAASQHQR